MKIGILTYHRSHNYGALLQSIATREILISFGHDVSFIDYYSEYHKELYALFSFRKWMQSNKIGYIKAFLFEGWRKEKRIKCFKKFIHEYIEPYCSPYNSSEHYDVIIYGSDQIWRKQKGTFFDPVFFADNILSADRHISYAASMGILYKGKEDMEFLQERLSHFDKISVRELSLQQYLESFVKREIQLVLDPTILLSKEKWTSLVKIDRTEKSGYIVFYDLLNGSFNLNSIRKFAKERNLRLIILYGKAKKACKDEYSTCGPVEFLSLIKYADFVFSSSYHGLIFSLIFQKQFIVSFSENADRAESLLRELGLTNRIIPPLLERINSQIADIEYDFVSNKLKELSEQSINFLSSIK